jgi:hypothetical protein
VDPEQKLADLPVALEGEAEDATRNTFRLRRPSPHADYELREGDWRVFYRVEGEAVLVTDWGEARREPVRRG